MVREHYPMVGELFVELASYRCILCNRSLITLPGGRNLAHDDNGCRLSNKKFDAPMIFLKEAK